MRLDRRRALRWCGAASVAPWIAACDSSIDDRPAISVSPFSADRLRQLLDALLAAYTAQGLDVISGLLAPIDEATLRSRCDWFPGRITPELVALYGWRGGQSPDLSANVPAFSFRDNVFCNLEQAADAYRNMMLSYGLIPGTREMLKFAFPFATFDGAYYVLPTQEHGFNPDLPTPVVSVFEGVDVYYYSLESMIETCVHWVSHPAYGDDGSLPADIEMSIWRQFNPGIFQL